MADTTNVDEAYFEKPLLSASPALPVADKTSTDEAFVETPRFSVSPAVPMVETVIDETYVEEGPLPASPALLMADATIIDRTFVEEPRFSTPPAPPVAEAIIDETFIEESASPPPPSADVRSIVEPYVKKLLLSVSPALTAVERPTPTTSVIPNPKPARGRAKKPVPPGPQIKRRPGRSKKDTSGRVLILRNGVERVITPKDVRRLNTSVGSNVRSSLPGFQNFKDSTDDCFFDLLTSVEAALLGDGAAPTGTIEQNATGKPSSTAAAQPEGSQIVESQLSGSATQGIGPPPSVLTAFKLLLPSLYRRSARNVPELYEISQTFWVRKDEAKAANGDSEAPSTSADLPSEPTFFYWDPMPLTTNPLLCPLKLCGKALERFGHAPAPRQVVVEPDDVEVAFWIIGARYQCTDCAAQVKGKGKTKPHPGYVGWDERIMSQLPDSIRKEFPAVEVEKRFIVTDHHRSLRQWADPSPKKNQELVALSPNWVDPDPTPVNGSTLELDASRIPARKPRSTSARSASLSPSLSEPAKEKRKRKCSKCLEVGCPGSRGVVHCDNQCAGCKRYCCSEPHRSGRNLCLKPDQAAQSKPSLPNPQPKDLGDVTPAEATVEPSKPVVNEDEEERSVEEALGLI
ncbi:hypothetical protein FRC00_011666 [Tulasnella sp. 408]|nr:hypothetical protein FRC00_011666 [Tulasnella sp. 408]